MPVGLQTCANGTAKEGADQGREESEDDGGVERLGLVGGWVEVLMFETEGKEEWYIFSW